MPVAGQDAILNAAAVERKPHVWTSIVEREDTPAIVNDEDRTMRPAHDEPPLGPQLLEATRADEACGRNIHGRSYPALLPRPRRAWAYVPALSSMGCDLTVQHSSPHPHQFAPTSTVEPAFLAVTGLSV